jgi:hypothetical protein
MKLRILLISILVLVVTLFGSSQVQPTAGQPLAIPQANGTESLVFTFKVPALLAAQDGRTSQPRGRRERTGGGAAVIVTFGSATSGTTVV